MRTLTLRIHRPWTESFDDTEGRLALHIARAQMLHQMADELHLQVEEWGETDTPYPREIVEIAISIASTVVAELIASYIKQWWHDRKVKDVEVVAPHASMNISVSYLDANEMKSLGTYLWDTAAKK